VVLAKMVKGTHFKSCTLVMCKLTGKANKPEPYFWIVMTDVFTTKVANKGGEDGAVAQDVELVFKEIEINYCQQDNDGKLLTPIPFALNVGTMTVTKGG
jgi:type VI secretion system secreted protein Hcp